MRRNLNTTFWKLLEPRLTTCSSPRAQRRVVHTSIQGEKPRRMGKAGRFRARGNHDPLSRTTPETCFNRMFGHEFGIGLFQVGKTKFADPGNPCPIWGASPHEGAAASVADHADALNSICLTRAAKTLNSFCARAGLPYRHERQAVVPAARGEATSGGIGEQTLFGGADPHVPR